MLKVMTPLLGTKTSSAPVGDASAGDGRAARSLLSCELWLGMGRLWRGMGGMGRPEPLSAHRPRQQQGPSGFHETRDTSLLGAPRGVPSGPARIPRFSRNTRHETRITAFLVLKPFSLFFGRETVYVESDDAVAGNENPIRARRGQVGWGEKCRPVAAFLRVMGRLWCGMGGMGRPEPLSAQRPHQQQGLSGFHATRDPRHGYCQARGASRREFRGVHESRDTKHESQLLCFPTHDFPRFPGISQYFPPPPPPRSRVRAPFASSIRPVGFSRHTRHESRTLPPPGHCFPARCGAAWGGYGAAWAAWGAPSRYPRNVRTSNRAFRVFTKPETRGTAIARRAARGALWAGANSEVFTSHETRITALMPCSSLFTIVHHCSLLFSKKYCPGRHRSPQLPSPPGCCRCGQPKMNPC